MTIVRAMPELLRIGFAGMVAYRAELLIWILTATLPLVMLALWDAVAADGPVAGLGQAELARYFAITLIVRQVTGAWVVWSLNWEIRAGTLSAKLLRPVHPLWVSAAETAAAVPLRLVVLVPLVGALVAWRPDLVAWPGASWFLLGCVSAALAAALAFLVQAFFGILSFWLDQSMGLFGLWFSLWAVCSGYVAPLAVFPDAARRALDLLPFKAMLGTPVELLAGQLSGPDALWAVAVQAAWLVVAFVVVAFTWSRGVRRYGAFGA